MRIFAYWKPFVKPLNMITAIEMAFWEISFMFYSRKYFSKSEYSWDIFQPFQARNWYFASQ